MPDMTVPPPNQCFADATDGGEDPLDASLELSLPPSVQPNADFGGTNGAEGAGNAGSDELVRRFANDGAGGAPGMPDAGPHEGKSCLADDLKALGSCGNAYLNSGTRGAMADLVAAASCAGAVLSALNCHVTGDSVEGR